MRNPYYMLWAEFIQKARLHKPDEENWKLNLFCIMTFINALNLFAVFVWLKFFGVFSFPDPNIAVLDNKLGSFIKLTLMFGTPFIVMNYLLIFRKNRYERIIRKYPLNSKSKFALIYIIAVPLFNLVSVLIYGAVKNDMW